MIAARHSTALCGSAHRADVNARARSSSGEPPPTWRRTGAFIGRSPALAGQAASVTYCVTHWLGPRTIVWSAR